MRAPCVSPTENDVLVPVLARSIDIVVVYFIVDLKLPINPDPDLKTHKMFSVHPNPVAETDKMFSVHAETLRQTEKRFNAWQNMLTHAHMTLVTSAFSKNSVSPVHTKTSSKTSFQSGRKAKPVSSRYFDFQARFFSGDPSLWSVSCIWIFDFYRLNMGNSLWF